MKIFHLKRVLWASLGIVFSASCLYAADFPMAPDFELNDVYQDTVAFSSYKGKHPLAIYFWGIWHPDSADELQMLNDAYAGLIDDGLEVLAINVSDPPENVEAFIISFNLAYQVLLDTDSSVASAYSVDLPAYVIINKNAEVVFKSSYFPYGEYEEYISK